MNMKRENKSSRGRVYLVGAGPGSPGLLTLRGAEVLRAADVVIYDRLVNPKLLEITLRAKKIYAGKNIKLKTAAPSHPALSPVDGGYSDQSRINQLLVRFAGAGKSVVRLKGGDPFIFGRGGEEASYLKKHGIPFEIVPGVTAGYAAPAYAGIPVTDRRFSSLVTFVTAHEDSAKKKSSPGRLPQMGEGEGEGSAVPWGDLAKINGTLVVFMGVRTLPKVVGALLAGGCSKVTPACVIE